MERALGLLVTGIVMIIGGRLGVGTADRATEVPKGARLLGDVRPLDDWQRRVRRGSTAFGRAGYVVTAAGLIALAIEVVR